MLDEKLELVQIARLGPCYDNVATVLNRCVTYGDSGLTWEADPRHTELAVAELGLQAARPQTSPGGAKPNKPLDHEELEPDGQKSLPQRASKIVIFVRRPTRYSNRLQEVQSCSRKGNEGRLHTSVTNRTTVTQYPASRIGIPDAT